jgi:hypothetical protein
MERVGQHVDVRVAPGQELAIHPDEAVAVVKVHLIIPV